MTNNQTDIPAATALGPATRGLYRPYNQRGGETQLSGGEFGADVAPLHWRFDAAAYDDIYVVGDVHGCLEELRKLWEKLDPMDDDMVVFVGDLVRKGPDSVAVVEFIRSQPNAVSVRGNNEAKIIHDRIDTDPFAPVAGVLKSFPLAVSWDDALAVHGGVHPDRPLASHDAEDVLEMRAVPPGNGYDGPFWFEQYEGPPQVFFGHTVLEAPFRSDWAVGLDTGCVYGGKLTAYDYRRDEVIRVDAEETYQDRPDRKFLDI